MQRALLFVAISLSCGCSAELGAVRCASDDNCPPGAYCSAAQLCAEAAACANNASPACAVAAPAGLSAIGGREQIALSWSTSGGAVSYGVRRSIVSGGPYLDLVTVPTSGFLDTGLIAATTYYYVVYANGPGGAGALSSEASALTVPAAPAHLSAAAALGEISLRWDPVAGASGYQLLRAGADGIFAMLARVPAAQTTYADSTAGSGATWSYEVAAIDATGAGPPSQIVTSTTP